MSDAPPVPPPPRVRVIPVALRPAAERYAHVAQRLKERGGIEWSVERVEILDKKIRLCRAMTSQGKVCAPILPRKIGEDVERRVQFWRVLIAGQVVTFVFSTICKSLISFLGPGEIVPAPTPPKVVAPAKPPAAPPDSSLHT